MSITWSWGRLSNSGGSVPVNSLSLRYSPVRRVKASSSAPIVPFNPLAERDRLVTRPFASVVTPYHLVAPRRFLTRDLENENDNDNHYHSEAEEGKWVLFER